MLTLEQIEEGRRLLTSYRGSTFGRDMIALESWFNEHAEALLDAAERVARQEAYANEPDGYDTPNPCAGCHRVAHLRTTDGELYFCTYTCANDYANKHGKRFSLKTIHAG